MGERGRRAAVALVVVTAVLAVLFGLDLLAAQRLTGGRLHLPVPIDAVQSVCPEEPSRGRELIAGILVEHGGVAAEGSCRPELHTATDWMLKASPYPPFPGEYVADGTPPAAGSAVVITGGRVVQVTVFRGVANTTPSRFVPSVGGEDSYNNDHYPTYLFIHEAADAERPRILFAAWASEETAGMEGIREVAIASSLLVLELAFVGLLIAVFRFPRRR